MMLPPPALLMPWMAARHPNHTPVASLVGENCFYPSKNMESRERVCTFKINVHGEVPDLFLGVNGIVILEKKCRGKLAVNESLV